MPAVLGALQEKAIPVTTVTVSRPSLDDVYLQYTGRSFKSAEKNEVKAYLLAFTLVVGYLSTRAFRTYQRSV